MGCGHHAPRYVIKQIHVVLTHCKLLSDVAPRQPGDHPVTRCAGSCRRKTTRARLKHVLIQLTASDAPPVASPSIPKRNALVRR